MKEPVWSRLILRGLAPLALLLSVPLSHFDVVSGQQARGQGAAFQMLTPHDHFRSLSASDFNVCGVETSGSLACWGDDENLQSDPPSGHFSEVNAQASCALRTDGTAQCWGGWNTLAPPAKFSAVLYGGVEVGACGIRPKGQALCWADSFGKLVVHRPRGRYVEMSGGIATRCGVRFDGSLSCAGISSAVTRHVPQGHYLAVAMGGSGDNVPQYEFACALRVSRTAVCWGQHPHGETSVPGGTFRQITAGGTFACGLRTGGSLVCWGKYPAPPSGKFTQITAGDHFACGLRADGTATCWGDNFYGQLGVPSYPFDAGAPADNASCGLRSDQSVFCWGTPYAALPNVPLGQMVLGQEDSNWGCGLVTSDQTLACWGDPRVQFHETNPPAGQYTQLSAGGASACAVKSDASIACWGLTLHHVDPPTGQFSDVSVGIGWHTSFACAIRVGGTLVCWGDPTGANGSKSTQLDPPAGTFSQVSAGLFGACALKASGYPRCWGGASLPWAKYSEISVGGGGGNPGFTFACGITTGDAILCTQHVFPGGLLGRYVNVTVGDSTGICGITIEGGLRCDNWPQASLPAASP